MFKMYKMIEFWYVDIESYYKVKIRQLGFEQKLEYRLIEQD